VKNKIQSISMTYQNGSVNIDIHGRTLRDFRDRMDRAQTDRTVEITFDDLDLFSRIVSLAERSNSDGE